MKKVLLFLLIFLIISSFIFSQSVKEKEEESAIRLNIAALKGPTAMGLVGIMKDSENSNNRIGNIEYNFQLEGAPDAIVPLISKGEVDIACIPANLASVLYNNTGKIEALAINTLGVLYISQYGGEEMRSIEDLRGKTIFSAGKGSTPEPVLITVLEGYGLEVGKDVFIEWKSEHAECVASLISKGVGSSFVAMLPQPFATSASISNPEIKIAFDLNDEWEELAGTPLVTGVVVARKELIENNKKAVEEFLKEYEKSVKFVTGNYKEASLLIEKAGIIKAQVAEKALPYCNIVLIRGNEMKEALEEYLSVLYSFNPKSVGGRVPESGFYYE